MIKEGKWQVIENANDTWNDMARYIKKSLKIFLENLNETESQIRKVGGEMKISKQ